MSVHQVVKPAVARVPHFVLQEPVAVRGVGEETAVFRVEHRGICNRPDVSGLRDDHLLLRSVELPFVVDVAIVSAVDRVDAEGIPESELVIQPTFHLHRNRITLLCISGRRGGR